jgi:hypothetical protein
MWTERGSRGAVVTVAMRVRMTWVTSSGRPVDHAVADEAMSAGLSSGGVYMALCGVEFLPASMAAAPGQVCSACRLFLEARTSMRTVEARLGATRHRLRRPGPFARLLAALSVSDAPAVPSPRTPPAVASPDGAAGLYPRQGRGENTGSSVPGPRPRRVPPACMTSRRREA